jgi:hypothetical protein
LYLAHIPRFVGFRHADDYDYFLFTVRLSHNNYFPVYSSSTMDKLKERMRALWDDSSQLMDGQRLERLEQCRVLESVLHNCRQRQNKSNPQSSLPTNTTTARRPWWSRLTATEQIDVLATSPDGDRTSSLTLENTSAGIRMLRFFHWREELSTNDVAAATAMDISCQREQHAVWGCRAVAVGCGEPLTMLRDCFDAQGPLNVLGSRSRSKQETESSCYYESDNKLSADVAAMTEPSVCQEMQRAVGKCVAINLQQLQQRVAQRASDNQ